MSAIQATMPALGEKLNSSMYNVVCDVLILLCLVLLATVSSVAVNDVLWFCNALPWQTNCTYEPCREKTGFLHMQKQRRRSASL